MKSLTSRHFIPLSAVAGCCLLTTAATGQIKRTAHPQETKVSGTGTVVPFGCFGPTSVTEARTQFLIRNEELPGPGALLVGIDVLCQGPSTLDYESLEIDVSSTKAVRLSAEFADNIASPVVRLLQANNLHLAYLSGEWSPLTLQGNYLHDGVSGLLIEVRKVVDPSTAQFAIMSTNANPARSDLPPMACAFGGAGSGASRAPTAQLFTTPMSLRLDWINAPTVRLSSDPSTNGTQFGLGGAIVHTVDGKAGALAISVFGHSFLDVPLVLAPITGRLLVLGSTLDSAVFPSNGHVRRTFSIPNENSLVGTYLTFLSATFDVLSGVAQFTNGADCFINR